MAITTLRPSGNISGAGNFDRTGGTSNHGVLADNSDATYLRKLNTITGQAAYVMGMDDTSIGATQLVRAVRVRARLKTDVGTSAKFYVDLAARVAGVDYYAAPLKVTAVATDTTYTGAWVTQSPDGAAWDQARVNSLRVRATEYKDNTDRARLYEIYADVDIAPQPTISVTAPTGTYTSTSRPDITWTYTDTENLEQKFYEAKVFSATQYGAVGFNPSTDVAMWESGQVTDPTQSAAIGVFLENGTYRAYVRAAKDVNNTPFFSAWQYSEFTINVVPPVTPTITASFDAATNRVNVNVNGSTLPAGYISQTFLVERSIDGFVFETVRGAEALEADGSQDAQVYDYEAPRVGSIYYRARAFGTNATDTIGSTYSSNATTTVTNDGKWWFKPVRETSLSLGGVKVTGDIPVEISQPTAVLQPIGSNRSIVVSGELHGEDGSFEIVTKGDSEWTDVKEIVTYTNSVLVQSPFGSQKIVRFTKRSYNTTGARDSAVRRISVDYVEVSE